MVARLERLLLERFFPPRRVLFLHIMKTGGSSFRAMLQASLGARLHPTLRELEERLDGRYPAASTLLAAYRSSRRSFRRRRVLIGHYPYVLARELSRRFEVATVLREPVARSLSMIRHRARRNAELGWRSVADALDDRAFVARQLQDYQTKIFALPVSRMDDVNRPFPVGDGEFELAAERLRGAAFVGLTEQLASSAERFSERFGIPLAAGERVLNRGGHSLRPTAADLDRIRALVRYDLRLYELAQRRSGGTAS